MEYKQGRKNVVVDALSRRQGAKVVASCSVLVQSDSAIRVSSVSVILDIPTASEGTLCIISFPTPTWLSDLKINYVSDPKLQAILHAIQSGSDVPLGFTFCKGLLFYRGRLYLGDSSRDLKTVILQQVHDSPLGGHSGYFKTLHRLQKDFYWSGLRQDLKQYVRECDVC